MKKIALFMAVAATVLASCSDDDNNTNTNPLTEAYLDGVWVETAPTANMHTFTFNADSVTLNRQLAIIGNYDYEISGNKLLFTPTDSTTTTPTQHTVEIVNDSVMKVSNLPVGPAENSIPSGPVTFKRSND